MRKAQASLSVAAYSRKNLSRRGRIALAGVLAMPALGMFATATHAANQWWDLNGTNAGATDDGGGVASGTWNATNDNFTSTADGTGATSTWVATGNTPVFSAGTNATGASSIFVEGDKNVNGMTFEEGILTLTGDQITLNTATLNTAATATINNVIAGTAGLTKSGVGTLTLAGNNVYGGTTTVSAGILNLTGSNTLAGNTTVNAGTLNLDYRVNNTDKINSAGILTLGHNSNLNLIGSDGGATAQSVASTSLSGNGVSNVTVTRGDNQSAALNLGAITRNTAAVINFDTAGSGAGTASITTTNTDTNGILGGYATFGGNTWAAVSAGSITGLTSYNTDDFSTAVSNNVDVTTGQSPVAAVTVNSVRFNTPASATVNLTGANTIGTGGILVTANVGGNDTAVNGGTLTSGAADIVVHQHNTSADFVLGSDVTGAVGLTKSGAGVLVLAGNNNNTGPYAVLGGTLRLNGSGRITDTSSVVVATGATLDLNGNDEAIGNLAGGGSVNLNGVYFTTGNNTAAATFSGSLVGAGGLNKVGTGTQTLSGASSGFSGETNIQAGTISVTAAAALGTSIVTLTSGATLQVSGTINVPNNLVLAGTGVNNVGALRKTGTTTTTYSGGMEVQENSRIQSDAGTLTLSGQIETFSNTLTIGGAGNVTVSGAGGRIVGDGVLIKEGTGTLTLSTNSTYTGGTIIRAGVVSIPNIATTALGSNSNAVTLDGGTLRQTNAGGAGSFLSVAHTFQITANGGAVDVVGLPTIQTTPLTLAPGTEPGLPTTVLTKINTGDFGVPASHMDMTKLVVMAGYYRLRTGATDLTFGLAPSEPLADAITLNGGGIGSALNVTLHVNRGITIGANGGLFSPSPGVTMTIPGPITGAGKMTFSNTGTTALNNADNVTSFTGAVQVDNGTVTLNESLVATALSGAGGTVNVAGNKSLTAGSDGTDTSYAGRVGGSGSFTKVGSGTLTLNPASLEWAISGGVNINAGTIKFGTPAAGFAAGSTLTIAAGATLDMNSINDTTGALAGDGSVINMGNLTVGGNNASTTFGGTLSGTGNLTKNGTGTMTVTQPLDRPAVTVGGDGTLKLATGPANASRIGTLTSTAGKLDLTDGRLVLTVTSPDELRGMLLTGRNADGGGIGQWNANGVISSSAADDPDKLTAIGYLTAAQAGLVGGTWGGVSALAATDVLVRVTRYGDITLDGVVDRDDITLMDLGLLLYESGAIAAGQATWLRGDVNYDGAVDLNDFVQLYRVLSNQGLASPAMLAAREAQFGPGFAAQVLAAVPEPASLGLVAAGAAAFLGRRRRSR